MRVFTITECSVSNTMELADGRYPFIYFDRGAGGGTHFFAHHRVVVERGNMLYLADRVSVAEESFARYWFMPEIDGDSERALVLVRINRGSRLKPYHRNVRIRVLTRDRPEDRSSMLILSRGAQLTVQRPNEVHNGLSLYTVTWDGVGLRESESEEEEEAFQLKKLTYI